VIQKHSIFLFINYIFSRKSITHNQPIVFDAVRVAKAEPTRLQSVQEGDAEVLLQARFNEAHGHPANAGAVFERIKKAKAKAEASQ
jgi:hypothetical protein